MPLTCGIDSQICRSSISRIFESLENYTTYGISGLENYSFSIKNLLFPLMLPGVRFYHLCIKTTIFYTSNHLVPSHCVPTINRVRRVDKRDEAWTIDGQGMIE
jgi:hypothetical protein